MPKTIRLNVRLTDEQAQSLSSVKTDLRNDSKVQALGGEVTDHTALRYILFEALDGVRYSRKLDGLESLARREAGSGTPKHDSVEPEERPVVTVEVEEDDPTDEEDVIPVKVYDRPAGSITIMADGSFRSRKMKCIHTTRRPAGFGVQRSFKTGCSSSTGIRTEQSKVWLRTTAVTTTTVASTCSVRQTLA